MDSQLLSLRSASLRAGVEHDRALRECNDALARGVRAEAERAVAEHERSAQGYGDALARLADYLGASEQTPEIADEARRTRRLLELLEREREAVLHRLEALVKATGESAAS